MMTDDAFKASIFKLKKCVDEYEAYNKSYGVERYMTNSRAKQRLEELIIGIVISQIYLGIDEGEYICTSEGDILLEEFSIVKGEQQLHLQGDDVLRSLVRDRNPGGTEEDDAAEIAKLEALFEESADDQQMPWIHSGRVIQYDSIPQELWSVQYSIVNNHYAAKIDVDLAESFKEKYGERCYRKISYPKEMEEKLRNH